MNDSDDLDFGFDPADTSSYAGSARSAPPAGDVDAVLTGLRPQFVRARRRRQAGAIADRRGRAGVVRRRGVRGNQRVERRQGDEPADRRITRTPVPTVCDQPRATPSRAHATGTPTSRRPGADDDSGSARFADHRWSRSRRRILGLRIIGLRTRRSRVPTTERSAKPFAVAGRVPPAPRRKAAAWTEPDLPPSTASDRRAPGSAYWFRSPPSASPWARSRLLRRRRPPERTRRVISPNRGCPRKRPPRCLPGANRRILRRHLRRQFRRQRRRSCRPRRQRRDRIVPALHARGRRDADVSCAARLDGHDLTRRRHAHRGRGGREPRLGHGD